MSTMIPAWVDGALTRVDKLEVHQRGLRHKAISVFVMDGDRVLIQRRALCKYHTPGLWANTCCTHPHWDELPKPCAMRRLEEELGITGLRLKHRDRVEYRADVGGGLFEHEVVDIYVADADASLPMNLNPEEVMQTRWVHMDTLREEIRKWPDRFTPWFKIYLEQYSDRIFGAMAEAG